MLAAGGLDAVQINTPHHAPLPAYYGLIGRRSACADGEAYGLQDIRCKDYYQKDRRNRKVLMISYQRHFNPLYRYIKQAIESGLIGDVTFIAALQSQAWKKLASGKGDRFPSFSGGGHLNDSGSHLLDMVL